MICKSCGFDNDKNALFCRKCHANLVEAYLEDYDANKNYNFEDDNYEEKEDIKDDKEIKSDNKGNNKTKTKTKTKNKTKTKTETKEKEKKPKKQKTSNKNNTIYKEKTPFGTKILIVLMLLMILGMAAAIGFIGYKYYEKTYNIEVPNLIGLTYEEAEVKLAKKDLNISKKEVKVDNEKDVGNVLKQSKKKGTKVKKGKIIKVSVGVLDNTYKMPNLVGLKVEEATKKLDNDGIKYNIIYETSNEDENTVIEQSISKYTETTKDKNVTLTVSKGKINTSSEEKEENSIENGTNKISNEEG